MANIRQHVEFMINTLETYVYNSSWNDDYDNICMITFYDSNIDPNIAFGQTTIVRYPAFQVRVRDTSFETAESRINAIREMFQAYSFQAITIIPRSDILHLGKDHKNRAEFALNFDVKLVDGSTVQDILIDSDFKPLKDSDGKVLTVS